eukprot:768188-Hanusia_phi.AAC.7
MPPQCLDIVLAFCMNKMEIRVPREHYTPLLCLYSLSLQPSDFEPHHAFNLDQLLAGHSDFFLLVSPVNTSTWHNVPGLLSCTYHTHSSSRSFPQTRLSLFSPSMFIRLLSSRSSLSCALLHRVLGWGSKVASLLTRSLS